jgi:hypothetical protein
VGESVPLLVWERAVFFWSSEAASECLWKGKPASQAAGSPADRHCRKQGCGPAPGGSALQVVEPNRESDCAGLRPSILNLKALSKKRGHENSKSSLNILSHKMYPLQINMSPSRPIFDFPLSPERARVTSESPDRTARFSSANWCR